MTRNVVMFKVLVFASTRAPLGGHLWHVLFLFSWFPIFSMIVLVEKAWTRRRARRHGAHEVQNLNVSRATSLDPRRPSEGSTWLQLMALAAFGAALVHAAVMRDHFHEYVLYGLFFLGASIGQFVFGVLLSVRPSRRLVLAGVLGSALMIVLWGVSRSLGVPIGPSHGSTEPFGLLDSLASTYEAALVVFGVLALRIPALAPTWRWSKWAPLVRVAAPLCVAGTLAASVLNSRS